MIINRLQAGSILLAAMLTTSGNSWAQSPHETYHRFHDRGQDQQRSGTVLYVQPSYPFTRYYIKPGQDPATVPHQQSGPARSIHRFHHPAPAYEHHHRHRDHGYLEGRERAARTRLVQDGSRLSLYDPEGRAVRQIYLRPGSSWERQFGRVIVRSRSRLEVYDRDLHRIAGMYLPAGADYSFRHDGIVVKTRFYTEIYDYQLRRVDRYPS